MSEVELRNEFLKKMVAKDNLDKIRKAIEDVLEIKDLHLKWGVRYEKRIDDFTDGVEIKFFSDDLATSSNDFTKFLSSIKVESNCSKTWVMNGQVSWCSHISFVCEQYEDCVRYIDLIFIKVFSDRIEYSLYKDNSNNYKTIYLSKVRV